MKQKIKTKINHTRALVAGMTAGLAAVILSGCDLASATNWFETKPPYLVKKSSLAFGNRSILTPIYWVDNDHALLPGYAVTRTKNADGTESLKGTPPGVYIWDIKNNIVLGGAGKDEFYGGDDNDVLFGRSDDFCGEPGDVAVKRHDKTNSINKQSAINDSIWRQAV